MEDHTAEPLYVLTDGEAQTKEKADRFPIPTRQVRWTVEVGRHVKLQFLGPSPEARKRLGAAGERMWVEVTQRSDDGSYVGRLDNHPAVFKHLLHKDDPVPFEPRHIIAIRDKAKGPTV
ncbi:MAG: DUF2314 domain-containing protein [Planctomycetota bacterium]|jgi:hypothetical protein